MRCLRTRKGNQTPRAGGSGISGFPFPGWQRVQLASCAVVDACTSGTQQRGLNVDLPGSSVLVVILGVYDMHPQFPTSPALLASINSALSPAKPLRTHAVRGGALSSSPYRSNLCSQKREKGRTLNKVRMEWRLPSCSSYRMPGRYQRPIRVTFPNYDPIQRTKGTVRQGIYKFQLWCGSSVHSPRSLKSENRYLSDMIS